MSLDETTPHEEALHELYQMVKPKTEGEEIPRFRFAYFTVRFAAQLLALTLVGWLIIISTGNQTIIRANLDLASGKFAVTLLGTMLLLCFSEYFLHLYPMHKGLKLPLGRPRWLTEGLNNWLDSIRHSHDGIHHRLTDVGRLKGNLLNEYPIDEVAKTRSATFPKLAIVLFWGVFAIPATALQLILPTLPVLVCFAISISWSVWLYENRHAIDHFPEDWWRRQCRKPLIGPLMMRIHALHFVHHLNRRRNLNVGGLFLVPLADITFGTYRYPRTLMEAWLSEEPSTDWRAVLQEAIVDINRSPWSFQIRSTLKRALQRTA